MEPVSGEEEEGVSFGKKVFIQAQEGRKKQMDTMQLSARVKELWGILIVPNFFINSFAILSCR